MLESSDTQLVRHALVCVFHLSDSFEWNKQFEDIGGWTLVLNLLTRKPSAAEKANPALSIRFLALRTLASYTRNPNSFSLISSKSALALILQTLLQVEHKEEGALAAVGILANLSRFSALMSSKKIKLDLEKSGCLKALLKKLKTSNDSQIVAQSLIALCHPQKATTPSPSSLHIVPMLFSSSLSSLKGVQKFVRS